MHQGDILRGLRHVITFRRGTCWDEESCSFYVGRGKVLLRVVTTMVPGGANVREGGKECQEVSLPKTLCKNHSEAGVSTSVPPKPPSPPPCVSQA